LVTPFFQFNLTYRKGK